MKKPENIIFTNSKLDTYLHTTSLEKVMSILDKGFFFNDRLSNTTDATNESDFFYWIKYREHYGQYTIVIQVPKNINYIKEIDEESLKYIKQQTNNDNFESNHFEFVLPNNYIRGYFILKTMKFIENPNFKP